MNTFSAFRFAARTLLHSNRHPTHFPCLNPIALNPRAHVRFKHKAPPPRPRDESIPYTEVSLVEEDNVLVKMSLKRLLSSINRLEQWVELVAVTPEPVVKIVNKKAALVTQKKMRERQREVARKNIVKEVQLTWGSEQSDLDHKLARVRSYLEMGAKVDIVMTAKTNAVAPPVKVQQAKVQSTIESLADIAKEWKPVQWRKNMAAIFLRGLEEADRKLTPEQVKLAEEGIGEAEPVAKDKREGDPQATLPPPPAPPQPPPRPSSQPVQPGQPKHFVDLSEMGYIPPPTRRNPLSGIKKEKKYGKRSVKLDNTS